MRFTVVLSFNPGYCSGMDKERVDIFKFLDYRDFIRAYYQNEKAKNKKFSHRFVANQIGASSSGWFSDLIKGRNKIKGAYFSKMCELLRLNAREIEYFEALIAFDEAVTLNEKNRLFIRILGFREINPSLIGEDKFEFYHKWFYSAIRELLTIYDFNENCKVLGKQLMPPISEKEAKTAILLLEKLGMITKDKRGNFRPTSAVIQKDKSVRSFYLGNLLKRQMELAAEALDRFPKEERDISSLTFCFPSGELDELKQELKLLRKKVLRKSENFKAPDRAFQLNLQLFPISKQVQK